MRPKGLFIAVLIAASIVCGCSSSSNKEQKDNIKLDIKTFKMVDPDAEPGSAGEVPASVSK